MMLLDLLVHVFYTFIAIGTFVSLVSYFSLNATGVRSSLLVLEKAIRFCWSCFFKPYSGDNARNQQDALESFYKTQASIYDATRMRLLCGREDMLGLVAAQVNERTRTRAYAQKPIWVDVGGGTGFNIEQMARFVDVPNFFSAVYLIDLSPSLCSVARDRFARLGWKNVQVLCQNARDFRLSDQNKTAEAEDQKADVITMSYSLSMIPEYYSVLDSLSCRLTDDGIIGVADFYVQSEVDYYSRNYIGGEINRHCMWISRVFWRTWFEADRVGLEAARRDYLEYRFGTILSFNARCHLLGVRIPYYVWIGCSKASTTSVTKLVQLNATFTESPFIAALDHHHHQQQDTTALNSNATSIRSKAYESAVVNLASSLPLPSTWYQTHHWRIHYDHTHPRHRQFRDSYIYTFTWEDSRVDSRLLNLTSSDVVLAISSAGDNILSYALETPARIHAVDLNPAQNHLLELKLAAFTALPYDDVWRLFGEGKHPDFRTLLITKMSPHLSSLAFQFWLEHGPKTFSPHGKGLYHTGGSRHALNLIAWLVRLLNLQDEVARLCSAATLAEQREIWQRSLRRVLLSRLLSWCVVSNKKWLWKALGVPTAQCDMIEQDYAQAATLPSDSAEQRPTSDQAIWTYAVNTLDPIISHTLLSTQNHYYLLPLLGHYTPRCHPTYLTPQSHRKLHRPGAFDNLRIHTDDVAEVLERMAPGSLTVAVVMDSMDWFTGEEEVRRQVGLLRRAVKAGGRVLLRSAGTSPWYVGVFEDAGFGCRRVSVRGVGECVDRVNMYASTWVCVRKGRELGEISIGAAAAVE